MKIISILSRSDKVARKQMLSVYQKIVDTCERENVTFELKNSDIEFAVQKIQENENNRKGCCFCFVNPQGNTVILDEKTSIDDLLYLFCHTGNILKTIDKTMKGNLKKTKQIQNNLKQLTKNEYVKKTKTILRKFFQKREIGINLTQTKKAPKAEVEYLQQ